MVAPSRFESFRSPASKGRCTPRFSALLAEVHLCLAGHVVEEDGRTRLQIDPESELVLEFDQAAELAEVLGVFLAAECGKHPREIAL